MVRIEEMRARSLARDEKRGARDDNVMGTHGVVVMKSARGWVSGGIGRRGNLGAYSCHIDYQALRGGQSVI